MQAVLVMFRSDDERRSFSVTRDMTVIGRREDCDLRIPLGDISRKHARLVRDGDSIRLEDLGSSNGTYLNGQRVQEAILAPGDSVQVGPVVFVLQIDGVPGDEELNPVSADVAEATATEPVEMDMGPLSPTAQSEVGEIGHELEPLPEEDPLGLAPLPAAEEGNGAHVPPLSHETDELDLSGLEDHDLSLLSDEHLAHADEPLDLDHSQHPHA